MSITADSTHPATAHEKSAEALLRVATKMFAQQGYDGTTVKDLADSAGVNVSLISYYFRGKQGLYHACLERFGQERLDMAQRILKAPVTIDEMKLRLNLFLEEMVRVHFEHSEETQMVHRECERGFIAAQDIFRRTFLRLFETLMEFFAHAQEKNLIKQSIDLHWLSAHFYGALLHNVRMDHIGEKYFDRSLKNPKESQCFTQQLIDTFIDGIKNPQ